jgi:phosphoglycerate dehydrogenase-like enzyme
LINGSLVGILGFGGIGKRAAVPGARRKRVRDQPLRTHRCRRRSNRNAGGSGCGARRSRHPGCLDSPDTCHRRADRAARTLADEADAILVNVARAAIIDEDALYEHLEGNPSFSAGIDAWWQEPRGQRAFATRRPFLNLPNVIGSPHNSAMVAGSLTETAARAAENVARHVRGEQVRNLVDPADYVA